MHHHVTHSIIVASIVIMSSSRGVSDMISEDGC